MSNMKRKRDLSVDVNKDDPFSLLDDHILCEILVRLPVKSFLQVKRVCKHWRSIVRDPYFVGLHSTRSNPGPKLLISVSSSKGICLSSVDLFDSGGVLLHQMKVEIPSYYWDPVEILNPVNGLVVCFKRYEGKVVIHNPSTGDRTPWIKSRAPSEVRHVPRTFYGFGFDSKTKEHKVVCLWHSCDESYETGASDFCELLIVGKNTWRRINDVRRYKAYGESVYVNGVVYWLSTYKYHHVSYSAQPKSIVAFDIEREKFRVIPIPDFITNFRHTSQNNNCHDLLVIDGGIGLLDRRVIVDVDNKNVIKMWIFHDDHEEKIFTDSNWTEEMILIPLEWEKRLNRCCRTNPYTDLLFQAITGTNLITMMPEKLKHRDVLSLYCYDRKKKTLDFVEINAVSHGKGFPEDEDIYCVKCGAFSESLCALPIMEPNQISSSDKSDLRLDNRKILTFELSPKKVQVRRKIEVRLTSRNLTIS